MLAENVKFVFNDIEMKSMGFATFGDGNWLHPSYPGMLFRVVSGFADAMANGAAFVMFNSNANHSVYNAKKVLFGADVGYHAYRDEGGNYPRLERQVIHERAPYVIPGPGVGTYANGGRERTVSRTVTGLSGARWLGSFGTHAGVLSIITRVPRGYLYYSGDDWIQQDNELAGTEVSAHPMSELKNFSSAFASHANSGPADKPFMTAASEAFGKTRYFTIVRGSGGCIFATADFDVVKYVESVKPAFLATLDSDLSKEFEKAWPEALKSLPKGSTPLAIPIVATWPVNGSQTFSLSFRVPKVPAGLYIGVASASRPQTVADGGPSDAHGLCSLVTGYNQFPRGDQPCLAQVEAIGEPNVPASVYHAQAGELLPEIKETFNFHRVPDLRITDALGETIVNSATLFGRFSPLTRPSTRQYAVTLEALGQQLEALRSSGFRAGKMNDSGAPNEDDPMFLTKIQESGAKLTGTIHYQAAEIRDLEPFSAALCTFGNELTRIVKDQI